MSLSLSFTLNPLTSPLKIHPDHHHASRIICSPSVRPPSAVNKSLAGTCVLVDAVKLFHQYPAGGCSPMVALPPAMSDVLVNIVESSLGFIRYRPLLSED